MTVRPFLLHDVREYVSKGDTGETKTVFLIGMLDAPLHAHVEDTVSSWSPSDGASGEQGSISLRANRRNMELVRYGLKGWRNFFNPDGTEIEPKFENVFIPGAGSRQALKTESLNLVKLYIPELAEEIIRQNTIGEADRKN